CGDECAKHDMDHCQACARACHACAQECRSMATMA
ncbi:MAG: four-helix bundle copper-binding protein, partial [Polaromonas sp.]|nr:four-helix bundle copper-binding protein [Polaromonas sp.]